MSKPDFSRLEYTLLGCRRQCGLSRPEAGEFVALFAVKDKETGEKGHFYYEYEWDKREVGNESIRTDNPALVCHDNDGPSVYGTFDPNQDDMGAEPMQGDCTIDAWESDYK